MADKINLDFFISHDPGYTKSSTELRFCCPFCGHKKPQDNGHRSLCVNIHEGFFVCHRCKSSGKIITDLAKAKELDRELQLKHIKQRRDYISNKKRIVPLAKFTDGKTYKPTPGVGYLHSRKIDAYLAHQSQARFSYDFYGGWAIVFPLRDQHNKLVGINARYTSADRHVKHRTVGQKSLGLYSTKDALFSKNLVITESPLDSLSLAVSGIASVAACGNGICSWLGLSAVNNQQSIVLAMDADVEGDKMAESYRAQLEAWELVCVRVRPNLAHDWNAMLRLMGPARLAQEYQQILELAGG